MRYIFLIVMSANPLQDLVLVLLVRVAEVPIPRSPVALAALAKVVAPLLRAPDDVPFLVVAVAAVVLRGVARRPIVGKVHNAPFAFCFRAVGLQPLVELTLAGDDRSSLYAVRRVPVELRAVALGVARLVAD